MRNLFLLIALCAISTLAAAQPAINVKSFEMYERDMDARVNFPKRDQNGEVCAIIKVVTNQKDFVWEPDALGITAAEYKTGEYWLYVPRGARRLTIKHEKLGILRNYQYPIPIQAATVYVMELVTGSVETIVKEAEVVTQWLAVNSTPEGASVFIEELLVGTTPFTRKYPEGDYTYRVELPRYHTEAGKVSLKGDRKTLAFTMRPKFGSLSVSSAPENGMMIYLDDANTGKTTPATLTEVPSGTHTLKLISQWYQPQAKSITVNDNLNTKVDFTMQPAFAEITIKTDPPADIQVDGTKKGNGTYTSRMLAGIYSVKAEREKHNPDQKQITVTAGTPQTITLYPKPQTGTLDITSTPFDANIAIDGKSYGTTPRTIKDLLVGNYTLTLTKQGYGTVTKTITVAEGKTTDISETLPSGSEITIASTPAGAQLWINGSPCPEPVEGKGSITPWTGTLPFGSHTLKLVNGKKEVTETITVTQDGKTRWEYNVSEFSGFTETTKGLNLEMIAVQGGTFTMGCTAEQGSDCDDFEKPSFRAFVSDFYMGKFEVTQAQWRSIMGNNPSSFKNCDNCPVEQVSWNDVQGFIKKLNQLTSKKYRLPTEAEWEYAARGGASASLSNPKKYAGSNNIDEVAWYYSNSGSKTQPVGQKKPNELGLYDMSGNVWEWCNDWYSSYTSDTKTNSTGPVSGSGRVNRGSSWGSNPFGCRVTIRSLNSPDFRGSTLGFRLVLVP